MSSSGMLDSKVERSIKLILDRLEQELLLTLPPAKSQGAITDTLKSRLEAVGGYNPESFRSRFAELYRVLGAE
jgi:hypothetical protein